MRAYTIGIFPMAESRDNEDLYWLDPEDRGIIPLEDFHVPRKLRQTIRQHRFEVRFDTACREVIAACAEPGKARGETWINGQIQDLYGALFDKGYVHTVECWRDDKLVGGLYGVSLSGAFFGESMFSRETNASKVALVHLVALLRHCGYRLLDTQFVTEHLQKFGAIEIPREDYHVLLNNALNCEVMFQGDLSPETVAGAVESLLQSSTQTS